MNVKKDRTIVRDDKLIVRVNAGEKRKFDGFASEMGLTTGSFVRLACNEYIERRAGK